VQSMKNDRAHGSRIFPAAALATWVAFAPAWLRPEPTPAASAAFDTYTNGIESSLARRHASSNGFLALADPGRLGRGEFVVEELTPAGGKDVGGALLHDWRGTAFVPGARAVDFERVMRNFGEYPLNFSPQVVSARVLTQQGDHYQVAMRMRQQHVITVVLEATFDVRFVRADAACGSSVSRSTAMAEIDAPGTSRERALSPSEDHGFLWRMNTYWSYQERDSGLYIEIESVSLTRSLPPGLGWAIEPFIESVPRESVEFTLRSARTALRR
jgi:hypothetical protein